MEKRSRLDQYPEYQSAHSKQVELQLQLLKKEKAIADVLSERARAAAAARGNGLVSTIENHARRMIFGEAAEGNTHTPAALEKMREEVHVLRRAIELQRGVVAKLESSISKEICELWSAEHREHVRAIAKAAQVLAEASAAERAFRERLELGGVLATSNLRPMVFPRLGVLTDSYSTVSAYLLECHAHGFVSRQELPAVLEKSIPPAPQARRPASNQAARGAQTGWLSAS